MAVRSFSGTSCPVNPEAPVFFILGDGILRFEERAGNLAWDIESVEEGRIIFFEPAAPVVDLEAVWQNTVLPLLLSSAKAA